MSSPSTKRILHLNQTAKKITIFWLSLLLIGSFQLEAEVQNAIWDQWQKLGIQNGYRKKYKTIKGIIIVSLGNKMMSNM